MFFFKVSEPKKIVGENCSYCNSSTRDWSTILAGNQLVDTKFENCLNWINRIRADDKKFTTAQHAASSWNFFFPGFGLSRLTSLQFIQYYVAGFYKPTIPQSPPSHLRDYRTMPG
jgi:hypothetical protein